MTSIIINDESESYRSHFQNEAIITHVQTALTYSESLFSWASTWRPMAVSVHQVHQNPNDWLQSNRSENKKEKNSPQMMSSVQRATYGKRLILSRLLATMSWWASFNFSTSTTLCLLKMSIKSSKILKWNVGVNIFRRPCHLLPVEVSKPVLSQGWRYWYSRDLSISLLLPSNALKHSMGKWKDKS